MLNLGRIQIFEDIKIPDYSLGLIRGRKVILKDKSIIFIWHDDMIFTYDIVHNIFHFLLTNYKQKSVSSKDNLVKVKIDVK